MKKTIKDIILVLSLVLLSLLLFFIQRSNNSTGNFAVVSVQGKEVARYPLDTNGTYVLNNGSNTLVVKDGSAYIADAHCKDKLCEKMGKIRLSNQTITCLPNKLTVTIVKPSKEVDLIL